MPVSQDLGCAERWADLGRKENKILANRKKVIRCPVKNHGAAML